MKPQRQRVAAYGLICDAGRILLCRVSEDVAGWAGSWTLPGGGIDFGEHPESAMIREVEEETGLHVRTVGLATVHSYFDSSAERDFHAIQIIYRAEIVGGTLRHETAGSTDCCAWHDVESLTVPLIELGRVGVELARGA